MEWADETIQRLRALWDEGLSTAEIGRRLSISKNAVVGKAHRLTLPPRPSPIRRGVGTPRPKRSAVRRPPVAGPTLPPLASTRPATPMPLAMPRPMALAPAARPAAPPVARLPPVVARPYGRVITCCWPIGEPGTPSFRFCDQCSVPGKPYCEAHAELAYIRVRDKHEDAA